MCKARKPDCPHCVIRDLCRFRTRRRLVGAGAERSSAAGAAASRLAPSHHRGPAQTQRGVPPARPATRRCRCRSATASYQANCVRSAYCPVSSPVKPLSPLV
ncbi:hypothetical protein [Luteimonas saliphila]|uniref:hypothetical protein n=1 Tax=Luteimonas saliphila TaxID=2804919 RepID=UPI003CCE4D7A